METLKVAAVSSSDAKDHADELVNSGLVGLHSHFLYGYKSVENRVDSMRI